MSEKNEPFVSVIILNYNGHNYIENCLSSVLGINYSNFEVVLVDNASTDDSLSIAKTMFGTDSRLRIVQNKENLGFSGGNNIGFEWSKGEYVAFLNNDTIVDPNWLSSLVDVLQNDESIGLAQSLILMFDGKKIQTAGWLFSDYLVLKHALMENKESSLPLQPVFEVPVASGASMITRRDTIDEVGLFDPTIPFFYDDTLLSFKVWLANKRVVTVANSKIRHLQGATKSWNIQSTTFNLLKAKICLMFDVFYSLGDLTKAVTINSIVIIISSLFYLKRKNLPVIYANFQALVWSLKNQKFLWKNRLNHWSNPKISPKELQKKIINLNLPTPLYLLPSKLSLNCTAREISKFEKELLQTHKWIEGLEVSQSTAVEIK